MFSVPPNVSVCLNMLQQRYDEAAEAYEEGLKTSPGDEALGRGLEDVLKAKAATKAPAGGCCMTTLSDRSVATLLQCCVPSEYPFVNCRW